MLTRRELLSGTAAVSIAAIASAHGVASAADSGSSWEGLSHLEGGAVGSFHKRSDGYGVFLKWESGAAELFYKEQNGVVGVFSKVFEKHWVKLNDSSLGAIDSLQGAEAYFQKVHEQGAVFFLKSDNGVQVFAKFTSDSEGVSIEIDEQTEQFE